MRKGTLLVNEDLKKKRKITGIYVIDLPVYRCKVEILLGKQTEKLNKIWDCTKAVDGTTRNYLNDPNRGVMIVFRTDKPTLSTVVHELCHATQMILKSAGHNHCVEDADEPFAYLLGYLVEEYEKINKKHLKPKHARLHRRNKKRGKKA